MIKQNKNYKVALIGDSLAGGGAEKVHSLLSLYFHDQGLEVHHCIFLDQIEYEFAGSLLNLGLVKPGSSALTRKFARFKTLKRFISKNSFDVVIDFRMRPGFFQEFLISRFIYSQNTIYTVHSGILKFYFPKSSFLSSLIYKNRNIIAVSKGVQKEIISKGLARKASFIHNPVNFNEIMLSENAYQVENTDYILASGRMNDDVKQFDKLIEAYAKSLLPSKNIKLVIVGKGKNREKYETIVQELQLQAFVEFKGFMKNPFPYYKNALFMVLSSRNEGFGNVLAEALATGTPVISFDCFSGPSEIIADRKNGLLVENQNFEKLAEAMDLMIEDKGLYEFCRQNALASAGKFTLENIGSQWLEYLKNNVS